MKTLILSREDINNSNNPFMWQELCDYLEVPTDCDTIELKVSAAYSDAMEHDMEEVRL